ncbi:MAG: YeeE/YedE family protein [Euryarchaeota archaeon]|nr:YeeE/YedE family protein [Euryarchaeota archaeon]
MEELAGLVFGVLVGLVLQRGQFCLTCAFRSIFVNRYFYLTRGFLFLLFSTMVLFYLGGATGVIPPGNFPYVKEAGLHNVLGGLIFGVGMVLAGGCASGTLFRIGEGNTNAVIALSGMLIGIGTFAEVYGFFLDNLINPTSLGNVTLPQTLGISPWYLVALLSMVYLGLYRVLGR